MATIEDIPSHVVCSECSTRTQVDKSSAFEMFGKVAVTFECKHCASLLTINSMDNFTTIDIEDEEYPIAEDEYKPSRCPACDSGFVTETLNSWICADCGATKESPVSRK